MKAKQQNYNKGRAGENMARDYLINKGFGFIEANFEIDIGEIDLIMSDKDWLVFVEVKFKSDDFMGQPEEMISKRKLSQVRRVAEIYLIKYKSILKNFSKFRIDAVCILGNNIKHYENVYA
jgi:putative endonuclease